VRPLKQEARKITKKWQWKFGLQHWRIAVDFIDDKSMEELSHTTPAPHAVVDIDLQLYEATVVVNSDSTDSLESNIRHELEHLLVRDRMPNVSNSFPIGDNIRQMYLFEEERLVRALDKLLEGG